MLEEPHKPRNIFKRISLGIIGLTSLIMGSYIGYELIFWMSNTPILGGSYSYKWYFISVLLFLIACWVGLVIVFIIFAYPFLKSAIIMSPLDVDLVKRSGAYIIMALILLAVMWILPRYVAWDPHLGEGISKDNFSFAITGIKATDDIKYINNCDDKENDMNGWKFVILNYIIHNKGKNPIFVYPESGRVRGILKIANG